MTNLDDILKQCPASDAQQRRLFQKEYGLGGLEDLQGAVVFGAASLGAQVANALEDRGIHILGFSDNDCKKWNSTYAGRAVFAPSELSLIGPIIIASKFVKDIHAGLHDQGVQRLIPHYLLPCLFPDDFTNRFHSLSATTIIASQKIIRDTFCLLSDHHSEELFCQLLRFRITLNPMDLPTPTPGQYFPGDFWALSHQEAFVDVGACSGDTLIDFLCHTGGMFSKYFALEPDPHNFDELKKAIPAKLNSQIMALPCAAGGRQQQALFVPNAGGESRIATDGSLNIEIITIDELLASESVSTIKIDVEGYEREVLSGARSTIAAKGPKLAVSVYHRLQDIWEIPMWIRGCNGGYRFYLRHHTPEIYDTVLYCVPVRDLIQQKGLSQRYFQTSPLPIVQTGADCGKLSQYMAACL